MLEVYDELFEQFFLFHKDIFMGFFLSWEDEYRTCFFLPKKQCFFSCLLVGKVLPYHWQDFATALAKLCIGMAKVCQKHGNGLPIGWQNLANLSARKTHTVPHTFIIV